MDPLLELLEVPLDVISSLKHTNCTAPFVICKVAEAALNATHNDIINDDNKLYWSQYRPRGTPLDTCFHRDIELLTTVLWMWPSNPFLVH